MARATAAIAKPIDANGQLYQQRALQALPLLVRQAYAGQTVYYSDLADEMKMPNHRNLNYVLGAVGTSLTALGRVWGEEIPPLQAIAVNRETGMPGEGFGKEIHDPKLLAGLSARQRKRVVEGMLLDIFSFPKWKEVLQHFGVAMVADHATLIEGAKHWRGDGAGESQAHALLKARVAADPSLVGIKTRVEKVELEYRLPTGDAVDVLFRTRESVIAVEVKSRISQDTDVARGIFQCVKYDALLNAEAVSSGNHRDVEAVLALGGELTVATRSLANTLGVQVTERLEPRTH